MLRPLLSAVAVVCALAALPVRASEGGGEKKNDNAIIMDSVGIQDLELKPAQDISDPVRGVTLNVTQFSYPGVPERAACRTVIKVANDSPHRVEIYSLIRTFDREKQPLSTWMTPSGKLAPGEAQERLYSCKLARYMVLDRGAAAAWPNVCVIDGEDRNPCPIQLQLDSNIDFLPGDADKVKKPETKGH